jgi:hypothetical protein
MAAIRTEMGGAAAPSLEKREVLLAKLDRLFELDDSVHPGTKREALWELFSWIEDLAGVKASVLRGRRHKKSGAFTAGTDAITYTPPDPVAEPAGMPITISGTIASNTVGVSCQLIYDDGTTGNSVTQSLTTHLPGDGTWITSPSFTLPQNNTRYLFTARFWHMSPTGIVVKDLFLKTGTPT